MQHRTINHTIKLHALLVSKITFLKRWLLRSKSSLHLTQIKRKQNKQFEFKLQNKNRTETYKIVTLSVCVTHLHNQAAQGALVLSIRP